MNPLAFILIAQEGLVDIREPVTLINPLWYYLGGTIVLGGLLLWLVLRRRRKNRPAAPPEPDISAFEEAESALQHLRSRMDSVDPEPFTVEVTTILRRFLEKELEIRALEQTTEEFLLEIRDNERWPGELRTEIEHFLTRCDLVKFARQDLPGEEREKLISQADTTIKTLHDA